MKLHDHGVYLVNGQLTDTAPAHVTEAEARKGTIAYGILKAHNTAPDMKDLRIKFDSMTSHDITLCGHHPDGARLRHGKVPPAVCADQLPQLSVCGGRHHQRGRPSVCPFRCA